MRPPGVLFVGQAFYHHYYLSRELRKLGWRADVLSWDPNEAMAGHYHGADHCFSYRGRFRDLVSHGSYYLRSLRRYDIFHFANQNGIRFGESLHDFAAHRLSPGAEIRLLKRLGKKLVYTNNGCLDGVAQSSFAAWAPFPTCASCKWREDPTVCSDGGNLSWGAFRNEVADFQCLLGGNRADFNIAPTVHEVPQAYCLDPNVWHPHLDVPARLRVDLPDSTVKIYHSVGDLERRSEGANLRNIKSTHVYRPLIADLKQHDYDVELLFVHDVPNDEARFLQAQADIVVDSLVFGMYGANAREAMMLGKPVVQFIRPEWLEQARREIPEWADTLPIVSATEDTIRDVLTDLITNREKREELGRRGREFARRWHSAEVAAQRFDTIYRSLLDGTAEPSPWLQEAGS